MFVRAKLERIHSRNFVPDPILDKPIFGGYFAPPQVGSSFRFVKVDQADLEEMRDTTVVVTSRVMETRTGPQVVQFTTKNSSYRLELLP